MVQTARHFGAFVEIGDGVVGLVSVNRISQEHVKSADRVLREGDTVRAVVTRVDAATGRVALSTKHLEPTPGEWATG